MKLSEESELDWAHLSARGRRFAKFLARGLSDEEIYQELGGVYRRSAVDRVIRILMLDTHSPTREALMAWIAKNLPKGAKL
jgi:hypothetical protein